MHRRIAKNLCAFALVLLLAPGALAQERSAVETLPAAIARTYEVVEEDVEEGDIIAYRGETNTHHLAETGDRVLAGVVVGQPLLVLETDAERGVSVVANGEVMLNVSTLGGPIAVGDFIAASPLPGKGWRARPGERVIAVAREPFDLERALITIEHDGGPVGVGSIAVLLDSSGTAFAEGNVLEPDRVAETVPVGTVPEFFKYLLAFTIAVGSLYISFRNFGANVRNGILSIGRNPLARASIQTMVILNIVLIILVGGGGLVLGLAILLLPT